MFSSPPYPTVVRMGNPFSLIIKLFTTDLWKFTYPSYLQCQSCFIFWVLLPYSPKKKKMFRFTSYESWSMLASESAFEFDSYSFSDLLMIILLLVTGICGKVSEGLVQVKKFGCVICCLYFIVIHSMENIICWPLFWAK